MRLRTHLGVLILATLLPMVAFSAAMLIWVHRQTTAATERGLLDTARAVSVAVDHGLGATIAALRVLATSEHLRMGNLTAFYRATREAVATQPTWQNVVLYDASGRPLMNTLLPAGAPVPAVAFLEPVTRALQTGRPAFSDLFRGRLSGRPLISVVVPVSDVGSSRYALAAIVTAGALLDILRQQDLPPDWLATLIDRAGVIIARTRSADELIGRPAGEMLRAAMGAGAQGSLRGETPDGVAVYAGFTRSPASGWVVTIAAPAAIPDAALRRQLGLLVAGGLGFALLAMVIAGAIGQRMARPLLALSTAAGKLATGEPVEAPKTVVTEVNAVMEAMEAASQERRRIDVALQEAHAGLEQRVRERTLELGAANAQLQEEMGERRRAEADADRANQAKSEFLSRMSHELRTPLNGVLGFAQLLELEPLPADQQESVAHILKAGRHLLELINEVLDISRIEAGRLQISLEPVPVAETLRHAMDLVRPLATAQAIALHVEMPDDAQHVLADRRRLQQVLLNLLSNAIKYNRADGAVTVRCEGAPGGRLRVRVTDTGPGIAPDKIERLFIPFDRLGAEATGVEGTGLGLALSRHLAAAMGGALHVESQVGVGSTFSVELALVAGPLVALTLPASPPAEAAGEADRVRLLVLYIEDNLSNLRLVERIMGLRPGVRLLSAMQGRVGLDLAREHQPDLILLDRHLPDVPGDEVLRLLREDPRTRPIPVVMLSADASPGQIQRVLAAGARAYLTKPLDVTKLLALLDETAEGG